MPPELILHVGDPKTGSSSIQKILLKREWKAPGVDIAYPVTTTSHGFLALAILEKGKGYLKRSEIEPIRRAYAEGKAQHLIISAEQFWTGGPGHIRKAIGTILPDAIDDARVLMYIRPHAERILSSWQQRHKMGKIAVDFGPFSQRMAEDGSFLYYERISKWKNVFGDRLEVRPFVRSRLVRQDVVSDFFQFVLQSENFEITGDTNVNESLSLEQLSMLRELHRALKRRDIQKGTIAIGQYIGRQIANLPVTSGKRTKIAVSADVAEQIFQSYHVDAVKTDDAFFEGTPMLDGLKRAIENAVPDPQTLDPEANFSEKELRVLRTWTEMLARTVSLTPERIAGHLHNLMHRP